MHVHDSLLLDNVPTFRKNFSINTEKKNQFSSFSFFLLLNILLKIIKK